MMVQDCFFIFVQKTQVLSWFNINSKNYLIFEVSLYNHTFQTWMRRSNMWQKEFCTGLKVRRTLLKPRWLLSFLFFWALQKLFLSFACCEFEIVKCLRHSLYQSNPVRASPGASPLVVFLCFLVDRVLFP